MAEILHRSECKLTTPLGVSYVVSIVRIMKKIDCVITALHCTMIHRIWNSWLLMQCLTLLNMLAMLWNFYVPQCTHGRGRHCLPLPSPTHPTTIPSLIWLHALLVKIWNTNWVLEDLLIHWVGGIHDNCCLSGFLVAMLPILLTDDMALYHTSMKPNRYNIDWFICPWAGESFHGQETPLKLLGW